MTSCSASLSNAAFHLPRKLELRMTSQPTFQCSSYEVGIHDGEFCESNCNACFVPIQTTCGQTCGASATLKHSWQRGHKMQNVAYFSLSCHISMFSKSVKYRLLFTLGPSLKVNTVKNPQVGNLTSWDVRASNLEPGNFNFRVQRERSISRTCKEWTTLVPLLLCHVSMNCDGGEDLLHQQVGQSDTMPNCFHKDHHLKTNQTSYGKSGNRGCTQRCEN